MEHLIVKTQDNIQAKLQELMRINGTTFKYNNDTKDRGLVHLKEKEKEKLKDNDI